MARILVGLNYGRLSVASEIGQGAPTDDCPSPLLQPDCTVLGVIHRKGPRIKIHMNLVR